MARVVVVGGGIGGLCAALLLGRQGHDVTVCERDAAPVPATIDQTWSGWPRPGTPQARLGHSFLAGFRRDLRDRLPDVLDNVLRGGAPAHSFATLMPGEERLEDDSEIGLIMIRRPVMEAALRRAAHAEPTVDIHAGCLVTGLRADPAPTGGIARAVGVTTAEGAIPADVVVIAGGRAVPVGRWFEAVGAPVPAEHGQGCGSACYTRYFHLLDRAGEDERTATEITFHYDPGYFLSELWGADNRTFAAEIAVPVADRPLTGLRHVDSWTAAALTMPGWAEWISADRARPISPTVDVMGQERNTFRRFVENGRPLMLGAHVIGDARCQTDSFFAWGCGNALMAAAAVADAIAEHPGDQEAQALQLSGAVDTELAGRYRYSVERNRARERKASGEQPWDTTDRGIGLIDGLLTAAADHDANVFRALYRWELQLDPADGLETNGAIIEQARAAVGDSWQPVADADDLPSRAQLLDAVQTIAQSR